MGALTSKADASKEGSWGKLRARYDARDRRGQGGAPLVVLQEVAAIILDNFEARAVDKLWENFIRKAPSFAVDEEGLDRIINPRPTAESSKQIAALFAHWSARTPLGSKFIDFMEIFMVVIFCSSMTSEEKAHAIFSCMDFEGSGRVSLEAFAVTLKSAEAGLTTVRSAGAGAAAPANEAAVESTAKAWFADCANAEEFATREQFVAFCHNEERDLLWVLSVFEDAASSTADADLELEGLPLPTPGGCHERGGGVGSSGEGSGGDGRSSPFARPWLEGMAPPASWDPEEGPGPAAPPSQLQLRHVNGYHCHDCRNNVRFLAGGASVVWPAGCIGVLLPLAEAPAGEEGGGRQAYFQEHQGDIRALASSSGRRGAGAASWVATGETGPEPAIHVWAPAPGARALVSEWTLRGFHRGGVAHLALAELPSGGLRVVSVGLDPKHSIAVYDLSTGAGESSERGPASYRLRCSAPSVRERVHLAAACDDGSECFITGGERHLFFWQVASLGLERASPPSALTSRETFVCGGMLDPRLAVLGCVSGSLMFFRNTEVDGVVLDFERGHAHQDTINCLRVCASSEGALVLSAGKDGAVKGWAVRRTGGAASGLEQLWTLALRHVALAASHLPRGDFASSATESGNEGNPCAVRSLDVANEETDRPRLLIGVLSCEIFQVDLLGPLRTPPLRNRVKGLVHGHWRGLMGTVDTTGSSSALFGMAVHPSLDQIATVGDDATLRLWDTRACRASRVLKLPGAASAVAFNPDGSEIAVGFGSKNEGDAMGGYFQVYSRNDLVGLLPSAAFEAKEVACVASGADDLEPPAELSATDGSIRCEFMARDANLTISELKYSPDGNVLCIASTDNSVYIYSVPAGYRLVGKFTKHTSPVLYVDISRDGSMMETGSAVNETLVCTIPTARQVGSAAQRDLASQFQSWCTWTRPCGWPVRAVWGVPECEVLSVDRSPLSSADHPAVLAASYDSGAVRLFRFPCPDDDEDQAQSSLEFHGHAGPVTRVRWSFDGEGLYSMGGRDRCLFLWHHRRLEDEEDGAHSDSGLSGGGDDDNDDDSSAAGEDTPASEAAASGELVMAPLSSGGDEFMAVKPWLGAIKAPRASESPERDTLALDRALRSLAKAHTCLAVDGKALLPKGSELASVAQCLATARDAVQPVLLARANQCGAPTNDGLQLEWVHGYRSQDVRGNLRYVKTEENDAVGLAIAYHAAAVGIVLHEPNPTLSEEGDGDESAERRQRFFMGHDDDIVSIAVHPSLDVVATGQVGPTPSIQIWPAAPSEKAGPTPARVLEKKKSLVGFHKRSVSLLCFSDTGGLLASVGGDDAQSIAIYNWNSGALVGTAKGDGSKVLDLAFVPGTMDLVSCGTKHIRFWGIKGRNLTSKKAVLGKEGVSLIARGDSKKRAKGKAQTFTCLGFKKRSSKKKNLDVVVGTASGDLYIVDLKKRKLREIVRAHSPAERKGPAASVLAVAEWIQSHDGPGSHARVVSGARDGGIHLWSEKWELHGRLETPGLAPVTSLKVRADGALLLVGTQASQVYEVHLAALASQFPLETEAPPPPFPAPLVTGHCKDQLWGLAVHPNKREYTTVGDDATLRVWDVVKRKQCCPTIELPCMARAVAYYPGSEFGDDDCIAVGLGGSVGCGRSKKDGAVRIYKISRRPGSLEYVASKEVSEAHDASEWVSDVKFSPNGKWLAVGAHDAKVYLYSADASNGSTLQIQKRRVFAKHSSYISHLDFSADSRFLQSNCGAYELLFCDVSTGRQITSATDLKDTVWDTWTCSLGWPVQGIWPACADGTDVNACSRSWSNTLMATADDQGKVKVFSYPTVEKGAGCLEYGGHSSHVTCCRWSSYDEVLITTGGNDRCIFQWRHAMFETDERRLDGPPDEELLGEGDLPLGIDKLIAPSKGPGHGEDLLAKPWAKALASPHSAPPPSSEPPGVRLRLDFVHGYNGRGARNNVFYAGVGSAIAYHVAAVGVTLQRGKGGGAATQNFLEGHQDDITCLAVSHDRQYIATGEVGRSPRIYLWHASSAAHLCTLPPFHERGVASLAFSADADGGSRELVSVGHGDNHLHAIWRDVEGAWSKVAQVASGRGEGALVLTAHFLPPGGSEFAFVSGGLRHLNFWSS